MNALLAETLVEIKDILNRTEGRLRSIQSEIGIKTRYQKKTGEVMETLPDLYRQRAYYTKKVVALKNVIKLINHYDGQQPTAKS